MHCNIIHWWQTDHTLTSFAPINLNHCNHALQQCDLQLCNMIYSSAIWFSPDSVTQQNTLMVSVTGSAFPRHATKGDTSGCVMFHYGAAAGSVPDWNHVWATAGSNPVPVLHCRGTLIYVKLLELVEQLCLLVVAPCLLIMPSLCDWQLVFGLGVLFSITIIKASCLNIFSSGQLIN